jgi:hypothetical protein
MLIWVEVCDVITAGLEPIKTFVVAWLVPKPVPVISTVEAAGPEVRLSAVIVGVSAVE